MFKKLIKVFTKVDQNEKLLKNLKNYEQKECQKQSKSSNLKRDKLHRQKNEKV